MTKTYNKTKINLIKLLILSLTFLASCGGGGNDGATDDNDRNVTGIWTGAFTKTIDTCNSKLPQTVNFNHNVSQNISAVKLIEDKVFEYLGNLVGDDGFSVDSIETVTFNSAICEDSRRIRYNSVNNDDDSTSNVDLTINRACPNSQECSIAYTGTGVRNNPNNIATPKPNTTVVPTGTTVSNNGGCPDMNEATVKGTYTGDGSCGISDAGLTKDIQGQEQVVILTPFGANGATTFVIDSATKSLASSKRLDLVIKGEEGYACSMICSAPSTFTIRCTKEGGEVCTEKF